MAQIKIRNQALDIDIIAELERYDWNRPRWTADKLQAASPFRHDQNPSFFVNLEGEYAGTWADLGASDDYYATGGIVKLLAFLRGESYEETEHYLIAEYGRLDEGVSIKLRPPKLIAPTPIRPLDETIVTPALSKYLLKRGISEEVQRMAGVGYGKHHGFCAIPWRRSNGTLANVMYRATRGKVFFYESGGLPIGNNVWGIDLIHAEQAREVVICEAPIDAMSWWTAGVPAVAVGGVNFSDEQADIIRRSPIEDIVLGGDNDEAGRRLNTEVERKLRRDVRLKSVDYGDKKDANALLISGGIEGLRQSKSENYNGSLQLWGITVS